MGAKIKCGKCGGDLPTSPQPPPVAVLPKSKFPKDILKWRENQNIPNNNGAPKTCAPNKNIVEIQQHCRNSSFPLPVLFPLPTGTISNNLHLKCGQTKSNNNAFTPKLPSNNPPQNPQPLSLGLGPWSSLSVPSNLNAVVASSSSSASANNSVVVGELAPSIAKSKINKNKNRIIIDNQNNEGEGTPVFGRRRCETNTNLELRNKNRGLLVGPATAMTKAKCEISSKNEKFNLIPNPSPTGKNGGGGGGDKEKDKDLKKIVTLWQNYYPEGQWGWVILFCAFMVQVTAHGSQLAYPILWGNVARRFRVEDPLLLGLLGGISAACSLILSPLWVSICKRKSTRLVGILGGLIAALSWLFTSFASQFHQLYISYGLFLGIGVGLCRDASCLMIGGYFKRRREFIEMLVVAASGVGIIFMSLGIHSGVKMFGWRLGLEVVTVLLLVPFFLGICYRSASLYHPQRRAILHLKNQRRKVKEKYKRDDSPPFWDWTCLKSVTLRILLLSSCLTAFGIYTPLFYLSFRCKELKIDGNTTLLLQTYLGAAWIVGSILFGIFVIQKNQDCRVSKQYLCQGSEALVGLSMLGLPFAEEFSGLRIFACVYGLGLGAHAYTIKVYTYERARARHFPRAWSFVQCVQGFSIIGGTAVTGFLFSKGKTAIAFYVSAAATLLGSILLFLADVRRKNLVARGKPMESFKAVSHPKICNLARVLTPTLGEQIMADGEGSAGSRVKNDSGCDLGHESFDSSLVGKNLASISEEGFVEIDVDYDADFQDIYFEDWEEMVGLGADAITSCNKVENCLMSEVGEDVDSDQILYYIERQPSTRLNHRLPPSRTKRARKPPPNFSKPFKTIQGMSFPPLRVASGVIGMSTFDPRTTLQLNLNRSKLCEIVESESLSSSPPPSSIHYSSVDQQPSRSSFNPPQGSLQDFKNSETMSHSHTSEEQTTKDVEGKSESEGNTELNDGNNDHQKLQKVSSYLPVEIPSYESLQRQKSQRQKEF